MLRALVIILGVALFPACGHANNVGGVQLPLATPEGASSIVDEFIQICSNAMITADKGAETARNRGWNTTLFYTNRWGAQSAEIDGGLTISTVALPHMEMKNCFFNTLVNDDFEVNSLKVLGQISGLKGREYFVDSPDALPGSYVTHSGEWSLIGPDGTPIGILYLQERNILTLRMMSFQDIDA